MKQQIELFARFKKNYEKFTSINSSVYSHNHINQSIHSDILEPSAFFKLDKNVIGFSTRIRTMVHAREIDAKIIQDFIGDVNTGTLANYPLLKKENTNVSGNAFCEIGVAFSRNLIETEHHKFNIGANVKYVMGSF
ncbi:DUF5723 family protein [Capnocytophaga sp. ARDL2]|uniref:DUF5723 family protein n=1 Tax=Capnocytophaga sp. ARDL2 TaxID=3238809 RepID=UPI0035564587